MKKYSNFYLLISLPTMFLYSVAGKKLPEDVANYSKINWHQVAKADEMRKYSGVATISFQFARKGVEGLDTGKCSGALIDTHHDEGPAYLLTAGHCYFTLDGQSLAQEEVISDQFLLNPAAIFRKYNDTTSNPLVSIPRRWVYATEYGNDVGILELKSTLGELKKQGIEPLSIAVNPPREGEALTLVGIPRDFAEPELPPKSSNDKNTFNASIQRVMVPEKDQVVHVVDCEFKGLISTSFGTPSAYHERDRMNDCSLAMGMSGGPLISRESGEIVGVASVEGLFRNDSEILKSDALAQFESFNEAADPSAVAGCFDDQGRFDLDSPGCGLQKSCGDPSPKNSKAWATLINCEKAQCEAGLGRACFSVAEHLDNHQPQHSPSDNKAMQPYLEKACSAANSDSRGCYEQAVYAGQAGDPAALSLFEKACDGGSGKSCGKAGSLLLPAQMDEAVQWLRKGCIRESSSTCEGLGIVLEIRKNYGEAFGLYARACMLGQRGDSCFNAAGLLQLRQNAIVARFGDTFADSAKNLPLVEEYMKKSCDLGYELACPSSNLLQGAADDGDL